MVGPTSTASAAQVPAISGVEEAVDAKSSPFGDRPQASRSEARERQAQAGDKRQGEGYALGPVCTTVAQVRAALHKTQDRADVVVLGRCSMCGQVGRVVHFEGVLRARAP
jgi:hypothetical protein